MRDGCGRAARAGRDAGPYCGEDDLAGDLGCSTLRSVHRCLEAPRLAACAAHAVSRRRQEPQTLDRDTAAAAEARAVAAVGQARQRRLDRLELALGPCVLAIH